MPTGAGKTRTAAFAVLQSMATSSRRSIWLAPSRELVSQAFATFKKIWAESGNVPDIEMVLGNDRIPGGDDRLIWLTTPQGMYSKMRGGLKLGNWDSVVFDEAHQLGARTFRESCDFVLGQVGTTALLGLSATPGRFSELETEELVGYFDKNLLTSDLLKPNPVEVLQRRGVLARLEFHMITASEVAPDEAVRIREVAPLCLKLANEGKRILIFSASVAGAVVLAEVLRSLGVRARSVHGGIADSTRDSLIHDFETGKVQVLVNQKLLATGYDCPAVSDVILMTRIGSPILFEQIVGRAARGPKTGGGRTSSIWQFEEHLTIHGLPQSYYRYRDFEWSDLR